MNGVSVVIPAVLRQEVLEVLGSAHQGVQVMRDRAADTLYWPGMHEDISKKVLQNMSENSTITASHS